MAAKPQYPMRVELVDGEVLVPIQDVLLWLRAIEERLQGKAKVKPDEFAGRLADQLRDAWIDACQLD